jgi:glycosyltransferase involved in cell wall biosynthesis/SAM-dependent methyltransferase
VLKPHWRRWRRLDLIAQDPNLTKAGSIRMNGDGAYYEQARLWGNAPDVYQVQVQADVLDLLPDDVTSVLDLGCGDGFVTDALPAQLKVVGIDLSAEALRHVRRPGAVAVGQHLPFADGQFDLVMANDVLEHLDDATRAAVLNEMQRVARKYVLITVPHDEQIEANCAKCADCGTVYHVHWHHHAFRVDEMVRLMEPRFKAVEVRYSGDMTLAPADPFVPLAQECGIYRTWSQGVCPQCKSPRQESVADDSLIVRLIAAQRCEQWYADHSRLFRQSNRSEIMGLYACEAAARTSRPEKQLSERGENPRSIDFANPLQAVGDFIVGSLWSNYTMRPEFVRIPEGIRVAENAKGGNLEVRMPVMTQAGDRIVIEVSALKGSGSLNVWAIDGVYTQQRFLITAPIHEARQRVVIPIDRAWMPDRFGTGLALRVSGGVVLHRLAYEPAGKAGETARFIELSAGHNVLRTTIDGVSVSWGFAASAAGAYPKPELTTSRREKPRAVDQSAARLRLLNSSDEFCRRLQAERSSLMNLLDSTETRRDAAERSYSAETRKLRSRRLKFIQHGRKLRKSRQTIVELDRKWRKAEIAYARAEEDYLVTAAELNRRMGLKGGTREVVRTLRNKLIGAPMPVPRPEFPKPWKRIESLTEYETGSPRVLVLSHMFPHPDQPSSGPFVHEQVKALREEVGVDARVLVGRPFWMNSRRPLRLWRSEQCYRRFHKMCDWWDLNGVPVRYVPYRILPPWGIHGWLYTQAMMRGIKQLFAEFPFDLIHAHTGYLDGSAGRAIARQFRRPMIVTEHTGPFTILMNDKLVQRSTLRSLDQSKKVIAVSCAQRDAVRSHWDRGVDGRVMVVPNMVDTELFHPPFQWKPDPAAPRILFVGYFVPIKGLPVLLDAFKLIRKELPGATLTLAGGGENATQEEELKRDLERHGLDQHVRVLGHQPREEIARLMREECDMLVLSSHSETFGCVVIEALASGKPVVSTRCGGPEDVLTEEWLGRLCPPGKADELAAAILDVAKRIREFDPAYIREAAELRFGHRSVALRIREVYEGVLT